MERENGSSSLMSVNTKQSKIWCQQACLKPHLQFSEFLTWGFLGFIKESMNLTFNHPLFGLQGDRTMQNFDWLVTQWKVTQVWTCLMCIDKLDADLLGYCGNSQKCSVVKIIQLQCTAEYTTETLKVWCPPTFKVLGYMELFVHDVYEIMSVLLCLTLQLFSLYLWMIFPINTVISGL